MRVADSLVAKLVELGIDKVFLVTGGGAMYLNDALALNPNIEAVPMHHEQSAAMAAVAYAKHRKGFGCCMVSSGCGGTNAITGLLDAWQDSVPVIFISGQVNKNQCTVQNGSYYKDIRNFGVQEAPITEIVKPISKFIYLLDSKEKVASCLSNIKNNLTVNRPGPVWIDVPLDIQSLEYEESELNEHKLIQISKKYKNHKDKLCEYLNSSERPIILAGYGAIIAGLNERIDIFSKKYNIPLITTFGAADLSDDSIGRIGVKGNRAANFAMQNSDCILVLGSSLSVAAVGYNYSTFAREAKIIRFDFKQFREHTIKSDYFVEGDLQHTFNDIENIVIDKDFVSWNEICKQNKQEWDPCYEYLNTNDIENNLYSLFKGINEYHENDNKTSFVVDTGSSYYAGCQTLRFNKNQRLIAPIAQAELGAAISYSVGTAMSGDSKRKVVAITGDGGFHTNVQELQVIKEYNLPIKIFVLNNNGYLSIRNTQDKFFNSRYIGSSQGSRVSLPNIQAIAKAYELDYFYCIDPYNLDEIFEFEGPAIIEYYCAEKQEIVPTLASKRLEDGTFVSRPLEDMYPFLDRDEFNKKMLIKPLKESE